MLQQCVAVTATLAVASVASRVYLDTRETATDALCVRLIQKSIHWQRVTGTNPLARHKHLSMALAFLLAAREVAPDATLERLTGVDVSKMHADLEQSLAIESKTK